MKLLDLTLATPEANIALDEALIEAAESGLGPEPQAEIIRLWEPQQPIVVIGRSSPIRQEVNLRHCEKKNIPVIRRCSGGASIVTGPGCLMYALLLDYRRRPEMRSLAFAHHYVMGKMQAAISTIGIDVDLNGTSDLTLGTKKFSGNSMRAKRDWMIYHGTMLCQMNMDLIYDCLETPVRQPEYRQSRTHREFLIQLPTTTTRLRAAIVNEFQAATHCVDWPMQLTQQLVNEKYSQSAWNYKR